MYREIRIRTGFSFFLHSTLESIKLFFQSIKFLFTRRKWDEIVLDIEEDKSIEEEFNRDFVNDFKPSTTVLFSSDYRKQQSKLDKHSIMIYRLKIQQECLQLVNLGYNDFIVNYGCNYGIIALSELLYMKNEFNLNINLYYGKVMHEHASCITKLDSIEIIQICHIHGFKRIDTLPPCEFIKKVVCKVSEYRLNSEY